MTKTRAVAYIRVSTDRDAQLHSYDFQEQYWRGALEDDPDAKLVGIYADKGISSHSIQKRPHNVFNLIHFASFKKHIGLYPGDEATVAFAERLAGFEVSKGTIRFPHDRDLPERLIADIAKWCYAAYAR